MELPAVPVSVFNFKTRVFFQESHKKTRKRKTLLRWMFWLAPSSDKCLWPKFSSCQISLCPLSSYNILFYEYPGYLLATTTTQNCFFFCQPNHSFPKCQIILPWNIRLLNLCHWFVEVCLKKTSYCNLCVGSRMVFYFCFFQSRWDIEHN